ncbi:hypothetical protein [Flavobacterium phragmitis]|uniref:SMI1/KNR4 family protein n=1 Tax=Flavobacterium phragmitis TaxID=739143 RepID=A0A1I1QXS7_9FLAO|nr:hypothetical protein [Flavobacterium phragmitis]SFD26931.1 hypothetical protein SAMN05216297_106142 [Flavobacterium phragmitis]
MTDFSTIKKLFGITEPKGFTENEIQIIKDIFGDLPKVFIDYYAELGKIENLNNTQDSLNKPDQFQYFKHNDYLIFYCENQRVCVWGIHKEDLSKPNPPVYMSYDEKEWKKETETLTDFFTAMAYLQAGFALEYTAECFYEIEDKDLKFIVEKYKNKGVSFTQWAEGISFYGNHDDEVIIVMSNEQLFYSSASEEHFEELDKVLSKLGAEL